MSDVTSCRIYRLAFDTVEVRSSSLLVPTIFFNQLPEFSFIFICPKLSNKLQRSPTAIFGSRIMFATLFWA